MNNFPSLPEIQVICILSLKLLSAETPSPPPWFSTSYQVSFVGQGLQFNEARFKLPVERPAKLYVLLNRTGMLKVKPFS